MISLVNNLSSVYQGLSAGAMAMSAQMMNDPLSVVGNVSFKVLKPLMLYNMYESALSDMMCLKTFRHGTNFRNYISIHFTGFDPKKGGDPKAGGEAGNFADNEQNSIYMERDQGHTYFVQDYMEEKPAKNAKGEIIKNKFVTITSVGDKIFSYLNNRGTLKYYSLRSSVGYISSWVPLPSWVKSPIKDFVLDLLEGTAEYKIFGLGAPSVKIHLDPDCIKYPAQVKPPIQPITYTFEKDETEERFTDKNGEEYTNGTLTNDSVYGGKFSGACRTKNTIPVTDIGICGILKNGLNSRLFTRIAENKGQFLWGVAQLVGALGLTILFAPAIVPAPITAAASLILYPVGAVLEIDRLGYAVVFFFCLTGVPAAAAGFVAAQF